MAKNRSPGDPYVVGFARPPVATRFKPGRSGNPRGRPKRPPSLRSEIDAVLAKPVTVTINGEPRNMTTQQALLRKLQAMSAQSTAAMKVYLKLVEVLRPAMEAASQAHIDTSEQPRHLRTMAWWEDIKPIVDLEREQRAAGEEPMKFRADRVRTS